MDISKIKFWAYREPLNSTKIASNSFKDTIKDNFKLQSDFERVMQEQNVSAVKYALPPHNVDEQEQIQQQDVLKYAVPDSGVVKNINNTPPIPEVTKYGMPDIKE